jgi:hypothetical protein
MKSVYPNSIQTWLDETYSLLNEIKFFEDNELSSNNESTIKCVFDEVFGKKALDSWLSNGDIKIEDDEITNLLFEVIIKSHMEEMKEDGIVNYIEDENNEEVFWLTKKGKDIVSKNRKKL